MSRFDNCKSLNDLYNTFSKMDDVDFTSLTESDKERLVAVFSANVPADTVPDTPLTDAGYTYIWNVTIDTVENMEETTMKTNNNMEAAINEMMNNMEGMNMASKIKVTALDVVEMAKEKIHGAASSVKANAGAEYQDFKNQTDNAVTEIKDAMGPVLGFIDGVLGYSNLKDALCRVIYEHTEDRATKSSFVKMAQKCRQEVEDYIEFLELVDDEDSIKNVIALRQLIGEDENGEIVTQSIFSAFAKGIVWVCKKVRRFLNRHFGTTEDTNIFGSIGASISRVFGIIGGVAKAILSVGVTAVKFVGGYALAAVVKGISIVADLAKLLWSKVKGLGEHIHDKFTKEDEELFEDELDEGFEN